MNNHKVLEMVSADGSLTANGDVVFLKLRLLVSDLITEVELLAQQRWKSADDEHSETLGSHIDFYEEVMKFEIALIKGALHRTAGHQGHAAALLNLNSTTLNAKIRQYGLRSHTSRTYPSCT